VIRVIVGEDNALLREGIVSLLGTAADIDVVGAAGDLPELERAVDEWRPDVVVTDIRMPPTHTDEGVAFAGRLRGRQPDAGVVVLSQYDDPDYAVALLDQGSAGRAYLLKERVSRHGELVDAVHTVAAGGSVIDPTVVERLVTQRRRPTSEIDRLTPREREVLSEMASGKSNAAIAGSLVLSERAVEKHTNSIFSKLGLTDEPDVNRRVKAVLLHLARS
jgi:DNA-binding NarL/FixJ family response regulator